MYILYHVPYSQHARRVVSLLDAAGLPSELRHVDMAKLLDGDLVLHESNAILRYLCHQHGLSDWYPADPKHRARVEQWLDWNQSRLSPAVIDIVRNKVFLREKGDKDAIARGEAKLREPTIADLSVASNLFQLGFAEAIPAGARIAAWYRRIGELDAFRKSLPARLKSP